MARLNFGSLTFLGSLPGNVVVLHDAIPVPKNGARSREAESHVHNFTGFVHRPHRQRHLGADDERYLRGLGDQPDARFLSRKQRPPGPWGETQHQDPGQVSVLHRRLFRGLRR